MTKEALTEELKNPRVIAADLLRQKGFDVDTGEGFTFGTDKNFNVVVTPTGPSVHKIQ